VSTYELPQLLYGRLVSDEREADEPEIIASSSPELAAAEARAWLEIVSLSPFSNAAEDYAIGIFADPVQGEWLLARCHCYHDDRQLPTWQLIPLPAALIARARGGLLRLAQLLQEPPTLPDGSKPSLEALVVPAKLLQAIPRQRLLSALPLAGMERSDDVFPRLIQWLNQALLPAGLIVRDAPPRLAVRLKLLAALQALLPRSAPQLTFSTNTLQAPSAAERICFYAGAEQTPKEASFHWGEGGEALGERELLPYPAHLLRCWRDGGETALYVELKDLDRTAAHGFGDGPLDEELAKLAERQNLAYRIESGQGADLARIKTLLQEDAPVPMRHLRLYLSALLQDELEHHDAEEAALIARYMDARPTLDRALNAELEGHLNDAPDAVYRFLRQRLGEAASPRWRKRLQQAAAAALRIATDEGDGAIIAAWLQLIAREPADFALSEQLHEGIIAAIAPAREDGQLGVELLSLALHYAHDDLPTLLGDAVLLDALPYGLAEVLHEGSHDDQGLDYDAFPREIATLALAHLTEEALAQEPPPPLIGVRGATSLWELAVANHMRWLPPQYHARRTVECWLAAAQPPLLEKARYILLSAMLRDGADEDFRQACTLWGLPAPTEFAKALQQSERPVEELLAQVNHLGQEGVLKPLAERETYEMLWGLSERDVAFPIVEQIAWWVETHPELPTPLQLYWRMLAAAAHAEELPVARIALRHLLNRLEGAQDVGQLVETLAEGQRVLQWSPELGESLATWWRRQLSAANQDLLRDLVAALSELPDLSEAYTAAQTALALRGLVGPARIREFAAQLRQTLASLEALAAAFEPLATREMQFDDEAAQAELLANAQGLSREEAAVLGRDCQELAHLLTELSDHRTRGNVMRGNEELERRLMSGQQMPAGAVDALKWLAGYWGGRQAIENGAED